MTKYTIEIEIADDDMARALAYTEGNPDVSSGTYMDVKADLWDALVSGAPDLEDLDEELNDF
mgnify:CR=1 FL=1